MTKRQLWYRHVRNTPPAMVPCLVNGIPCWRVAMGTNFTRAKILAYFASVPRRYWPDWVKREARREKY